MRRLSVCVLLLLCAAGCTPAAPPPRPTPPPARPAPSSPAYVYPPARRGDVVEAHHGTSVPDPYRWLEDMASTEARAWIDAENQLTDGYFNRLQGRAALRERLTDLLSYESYRPPLRRGGRYFWVRRDRKADQPVLYAAPTLEAEPATILDANALSSGGTVAFAGFSLAHDGSLLAYGLSPGGGDWQTWHIRDLKTGQDLPEALPHIKYYHPVFTRDGKGLYYSRFPAPTPGKELTEADHDCKVYYHRIGTSTDRDVVVYERPEQPTWQFALELTHDGRYLVITAGDGEVWDRGQEQIFFLDLARPGARVTPLISAFEAEYLFIGNEGPVFHFVTTQGAQRKRVIAIDTRSPARERWGALIPEGPEAIADVHRVGGQLLVTTLKDAHSAVTAYDLKGRRLREVALPGLGSIFGISGGPDDKEAFYYYTSFTTPGAVYRYELASGKSQLFREPSIPFDAASLATTQVFFPSKDGTRVPMFLTAKKDLPRDGARPTLVTAYGFGGISMTPFFDAALVAWLERGGIVGLVNVRGGGEYGEAWHQVAMRTHKQVTIDDFLAAGEWLIQNRYTSSRNLGAYGASGGGMLVAAALVQRPDLFGAVVPLVGVHDLLRFPLFGEGAGWQGDLGSPDDPAEFKALLSISPLHNVRAGTRYPALLLVTSDHDVRVAPLHTYKFGAALQAAQSAPAPVLVRVRTSAGHGGGTGHAQRIEDKVEFISFFADNLGLKL